tara:strand:- start:1517 stop:2272 length:756 start_codon:yes stop_codon:yes gene_type:complete
MAPNKGEQGELDCVQKLRTMSIEDAVKIFGEEAQEGITIINPKTMLPYDGNNSKTGSKFKSDVVVRMNKTGNDLYCSIKTVGVANPSIVNVTRRSMFVSNRVLSEFLYSFDILVDKYKEHPKNKENKSEADIYLKKFTLPENVKNDIVKGISYFAFEGTGTGLSEKPADKIMSFDKRTGDIEIKEKTGYILSIWDKLQVVLRGHHLKKNGDIRTNGLLKEGLGEDDKRWGIIYTRNGIEYPRGALGFRLKK